MVAAVVGCQKKTAEPYVRISGPSPAVTDLPAAPARLLVFWATWCPSCRDETEELIALAARPPAGLAVVVISEDDDPAAIQSFFQGQPPDVLHLRRDPDGRLAGQFGARTLPVSFLEIDGVLHARFDGPRRWHSLMRPTLARLLSR